MIIDPRVYLVVACLILFIPIKYGLTDDAPELKYLPKDLHEPKGLDVKHVSSMPASTISLNDALTGYDLQLEIVVNGEKKVTPCKFDFRANEELNIKFDNENYLPREYNYVLKGEDANKSIVINCYPKIAIVKGDVLNPDGSVPESVEIKLSESLPESYYPGYHKIRNYIDAEGKYFLLLPEKSVKEKIKLELSSFESKFSTDLALIKSQAIKHKNYEIPVFEAEIAMPDEAIKEVKIEKIMSSLKFKNNGKLSFEQAYKIEKIAGLDDYELLISTYISSYELAEDDITKNFIKSRLFPIALDKIRQFELMSEIDKGLELTKKVKKIFANDRKINEFYEIFEYENIPANLKSALNDAFVAFNDKDFIKSYYLLKRLTTEKLLTEKLRSKVLNMMNESRDLIIRDHVKKATDYFTNENYLKSIWEIDKAYAFSKDLPILQLLAETILRKLDGLNDTSSKALPLRNNWYKNEGDFEISKMLNFNKPGASKWYMLSLENYSQIKIVMPMRNIDVINYKFKIFLADEESLEPSTEVFSFDSDNVKLPEKKKNTLSGNMGGGGGIEVKTAKDPNVDEPKDEKLSFNEDFHKETLGEFIFASGKYFIQIESNKIEGFQYSDASCGLVLSVSQMNDEADVAIKKIEPGKDFESAEPLNQGFYTSFKIKPTESHWYVVEGSENKHLELGFAGLDDFSQLGAKVYKEKEKAVNAVDSDIRLGSYIYKLEKQKFYVEITNNGQSNIDFSMLVKIFDSSLFKGNKVGTSFENAIPLASSKSIPGKTRRNNNVYYKFLVKRDTYISIRASFNNRVDSDVELRVYSEDENKKRTLYRSEINRYSSVYFRDRLTPGTYYVMVKCNSLREQTFQIRLSGGVSMISTGNSFRNPVRGLTDGKDKNFEINASEDLWVQFEVEEFGELNITCKLKEGSLSEDEYDYLVPQLIGNAETDVIMKDIFDSSKKAGVLKKLVGKGIYHLCVQNNTNSSVKISVNCVVKKIDPNISFEKAISIPNKSIRGLLAVTSGMKRYFKINVPKKGFLQIYSIFKFNKGDINLRLYDAQKKLVKSAETKSNDELLIVNIEKGDYFIEIENITKGLENSIRLILDFDDGGATDVTTAEFWDVKVPEDIDKRGEFEHEKKFIKQSWSKFRLARKRRIKFTAKSEKEDSKYSIKIYHGEEIVEDSSSTKGMCFINSEMNPGIYFVLMTSDAETEITTKIQLFNYPSSSVMRGEFDNITRDSATVINKTSLFPLIYQGEQSLWYKIVANSNTNSFEIALYSQDEKYEYTLSLYESNTEEPLVVQYSNEFPVVINHRLQPGKTYYAKLEPVEPVQSSKIVLAFLVGPDRFRSNNLSSPFPLASKKPYQHSISRGQSSYYVLCFAGRTKYKITCSYNSASSSGDIDIAFQKLNGEIISDSAGTGSLEIIDGEIDAGIYRVVVSYNEEYWGNTKYTISAEYEIVGDLLIPTQVQDVNTVTWKNISKDKAESIEPDKLKKGAASNTPAWYSFFLSDNSKVTIELKFDNSQGNLDLTLQNASGADVATSSTAEGIERIQEPCSNGIYYIRVASFEDSKQVNFELSLKLEDIGGGHSRTSAIITKLRHNDKQDERKFDTKIECTMENNFPTWYKVVFEKPIWLKLEAKISGGAGGGDFVFYRAGAEIDKEDEMETVFQLYLNDPSRNEMREGESNNNSASLGLAEGTYYIELTGRFKTANIDLIGTYIDGITDKTKAPTISSGVFKGMTMKAQTSYWFKVKSSNTFSILSSAYNETEINNVELVLQSSKVDVYKAFKDKKSAVVFSEVAGGEYYIQIKNTAKKNIQVDFQVMILNDSSTLSNAKLLKSNSKTTGKFERNSYVKHSYIFVLTEQSKVKISFKLVEGRGYPRMNIVRISLPPGENKSISRDQNNQGNLFEGKLSPGVYVVTIANNYYRESDFIFEFEIEGSDFIE